MSWFINGIKEFTTTFNTTFSTSSTFTTTFSTSNSTTTTYSTSKSTTTSYSTSKSTTTSYNTSHSTTTTYGTSRGTSRSTTGTVTQYGGGSYQYNYFWLSAPWSQIQIKWGGNINGYNRFRNIGGGHNWNSIGYGGYTYYKQGLRSNTNDGYPFWNVNRTGPSTVTTSYTTYYNTSRSTTTTYGTSHSTTTTYGTSHSTTTSYNTSHSTTTTYNTSKSTTTTFNTTNSTTRTTNFYA